jgi:hypothetical protein
MCDGYALKALYILAVLVIYTCLVYIDDASSSGDIAVVAT